MGTQLEMFPQPARESLAAQGRDADDDLNAAQAEMRLERMARDRWRREDGIGERRRRRRAVRQLELGLELAPDDEEPSRRPRTRADCADGPRPCPWVGCRWNLYLDIGARTNGRSRVHFPAHEPEAMRASCVLDVAEQGGATLDEVADAMNLSRERVRQIEVLALARLNAILAAGGRRRRLPVVEQR